MKLSTPRYTFCLIVQFFFLFCDLIFNCVSLFPKSRDSLLVLFIFQDLFLVLSMTTLLVTFFSTYLFQAGLVEVVWRRMLGAGCLCALYCGASALLHAAWLRNKWSDQLAPTAPPLAALFTLHRCLSPWYYYVYKRAALRVSDPRLYEDIDWINRQLRPR